ncbi:MAG: WD40 repeat domain-containing protein [Pirellulaceae bacterium]
MAAFIFFYYAHEACFAMTFAERIPVSLVILLAISKAACGQQTPVSYLQVAPVLKQYCSGCHDGAEPEGDFSTKSWSTLMAGTPDGPVLVAGKLEQSRLWQLLNGQSEPAMPPVEEPQPTAEELALLRQWIEQGALGESADPTSQLHLDVPNLSPAPAKFHFVGAACQVTESAFAIGGLGQVRLMAGGKATPVWTADGLAGKVNSLRPSPSGNWLVVGGGIAGVGGEALLLDAKQGTVVQRFVGHDDTIYCAATSPDGRWLATGSYDRRIHLWDIASGQIVRTLTGHNGAIYDLDFDPSGQLLATASADQTVKIWRVENGERLDTLGQPEGEQRAVRFSPDGQFVCAAGTDKQIRKWQIVSHDQPAINPLLVARYAHEAEIVQLAFVDQQRLLSSSTDKTVKLWDFKQISGLETVANLSDVPVGLCLPGASLDGASVVQIDALRLPLKPTSPQPSRSTAAATAPATETPATETDTATIAELATQRPPSPAVADQTTSSLATQYDECEPNNSPEHALAISPAAVVSGTIAAATDGVADQDLLRFHATPDQTWIIEVNAARTQSPLDSRIDILDTQGEPVLRTRLQATRASYFTFRGKDSTTSDDFRLHKWEDMELDEYLYTNGEVNRLWLYPRGPDSGFKVYPGAGHRYAYYDTTPLAHALGQTTYIVRELATDEVPLPNGLPVFPIFYQNDDDGLARLGKDSRLTFVAPVAGDYFLRIRDARGFGGDDYKYQLTLRPPQPDFQLSLTGTELKLPVQSGREWTVAAQRIDGLEGEISIELSGLPEGVMATNPLIIEAGQNNALGCLYVTAAAIEKLGEQKTFEVNLTATAQTGEQTITRALTEKLKVTIEDMTEVQLRLVTAVDPIVDLEELSIAPGQTITARVVVERNGTESRIELGKEDSGRNLPHGAFVDNIGLSGLLIPEGQTQREFFITAAPKVAPGRRQFHLRSGTAGNPTSRPIWLNVVAQ